MSVLTITKENFESEVINSEKTVLLDFYATWCAPCRIFAPVIEKIAEETPDIKVGKVNIDEEQELTANFGVMGVPTLVVFKNGRAVKKSSGVKPKSAVLEMVK
ncbi:MAG: thioredoxin [Oscillospiraceae bacterium]|nr:thioredoxin [Oscillospiraceae bacterium]